MQAPQQAISPETGKVLSGIPATFSWFQKAYPKPASKNLHTQIGVHFEEVREFIAELDGQDTETNILLGKAESALGALATHLKENDNVILIPNRKLALDALCDQIVTGVGVGYMAAMQIVPALDEVNRSNFSKFENGRPILDKNKKVMKGKDYFKPDLTPFV